jgi:hypothetical protein
LKELDDLNVKIRNTVVGHVRPPPSMLNSFDKCAGKMKSESKKLMCLDITMRWNSSYMILEAAEFNEKVFDWVEEDR